MSARNQLANKLSRRQNVTAKKTFLLQQQRSEGLQFVSCLYDTKSKHLYGFFTLQTEMVEILFVLAQSNFTKMHKILACCGAEH